MGLGGAHSGPRPIRVVHSSLSLSLSKRAELNRNRLLGLGLDRHNRDQAKPNVHDSGPRWVDVDRARANVGRNQAKCEQNRPKFGRVRADCVVEVGQHLFDPGPYLAQIARIGTKRPTSAQSWSILGKQCSSLGTGNSHGAADQGRVAEDWVDILEAFLDPIKRECAEGTPRD